MSVSILEVSYVWLQRFPTAEIKAQQCDVNLRKHLHKYLNLYTPKIQNWSCLHKINTRKNKNSQTKFCSESQKPLQQNNAIIHEVSKLQTSRLPPTEN